MRRERRRVALKRRTRGTEVEIELKLDGTGRTSIDTPFSLLNELLELLAAYSGLDLRMVQSINKHADDSYAVDDLATALAEAWRRALGQRPRIRQFGSALLPVGDSLVLAAADLVSPPVFQFGAGFVGQRLEGMELAHIERFLATFTDRIGAGLHVRVLAGKHDGNKCRAIFVAVGRCLAEASAEVDREPGREVAADVDYLESVRRPPARITGLDEAVVEELDEGEAETETAAALPGDYDGRSPRRGRRGERPSRSERGGRPERGRRGEMPPRLTAAGAEDLLEMSSMTELPELPELPDYPDLDGYERVGPEEPGRGPATRDDDAAEEDARSMTTRRRRRGRRGGRGRRRGERAEAPPERTEEEAGAPRDDDFARREEEFARREEEPVGREEEFARREEEPVGREEEFARREEEFARREEEPVGREEDFPGREEAAEREGDLAGREEELVGQEEELARRDGEEDWAPAAGLPAPRGRRRDRGEGRPSGLAPARSRGRAGRRRREEELGDEGEPGLEPAEMGRGSDESGGRSQEPLLSADGKSSRAVSYGRSRRSVRRTGSSPDAAPGDSEEPESTPEGSVPSEPAETGAAPSEADAESEQTDVLDFITSPRGTHPAAAKPRRKRR